MRRLNMIVVLFFCYLAVFSFGQLTRLPLLINGFPEIHFYLTDLLVSLLVLFWLVEKLLRGKRIVLPPLAKPVFLFFLFAFLSLLVNSPLLSSGEVGVAILYLIRWLVYAGLYFTVYDLEQRTKNKEQRIFNSLILVGFVTAVLGLAQYFFLPDTRFLESYGWDPHYYRVIGTFLDPGFLGLILVFTLILLTVKLWQIRKFSPTASAWLIVYLALALTYSRASFLAYLVGMGVIAWFKKSPKFFLAILFGGVVTLLLLPRPGGEGVKLERESTVEARIHNWQQSIEIAQDNWLLGVGFNAYRYAQKKYGFSIEKELKVSHAGAGADSSLLFVLATTGILGLGTYLWLWIKAFLLSSKGTEKLTNQVAMASILAVFIHSFFTNSFFYPWTMAWLWIVLGGIRESKSP